MRIAKLSDSWPVGLDIESFRESLDEKDIPTCTQTQTHLASRKQTR